ncbi:MAG: DUF1801 domain-containing protein [Pseudomonadota bacterium]
MAKNKTTATRASVTAFVNGIADADRRRDLKAVMAMLREITGKRPVMWGPAIIGYGRYHYRYDSGREGDFFKAGVSPRARDLTVYLMPGGERYAAPLKKLGKHRLGKSCLYIKRLQDVDTGVLQELMARAYADMCKKYGDD